MKTNCETEFHTLFEEIKTFVADSINIPVSIPRITPRRVHRANIAADSPVVYYLRNSIMPFLNHNHRKRNQISINSPDKDKTAWSRSIHGCVLCLFRHNDVSKLYKSDLPSPQLLSTEFNSWKIKFISASTDGSLILFTILVIVKITLGKVHLLRNNYTYNSLNCTEEGGFHLL